MATPAQIEANRRNALNSTGPRTDEGKARSAMNALRHGFLSRQLLTPDENPALLEAFSADLRADLVPLGALEELLVEQMIAAAWRLRRLAAIDAGMWHAALVSDFKGSVLGAAAEECPKVSRYFAALERSFYRALHELQRLQAARAGRSVPPPAIVDVNIQVQGDL